MKNKKVCSFEFGTCKSSLFSKQYKTKEIHLITISHKRKTHNLKCGLKEKLLKRKTYFATF